MFHSSPFKLVFKVGKRITLNSRPAWAKVWNFVHNVRCSALVSSCYVVKPCQIIIHNTTVWTRLHYQQPKKMSDELQRTWKLTIFYFLYFMFWCSMKESEKQSFRQCLFFTLLCHLSNLSFSSRLISRIVRAWTVWGRCQAVLGVEEMMLLHCRLCLSRVCWFRLVSMSDVKELLFYLYSHKHGG